MKKPLWLDRWRPLWTTLPGRLASLAVLLVLGYAVLAGVVLPKVLRGQAERRLTALVGGRVTVDTVGFQPFSWTLRVGGFRMEAPDGSWMLGWSNLVVDAQSASLWRREVVLRSVELDGWGVRVARDADGAMEWARLGQRLAAQTTATNDAAQPAPTSGATPGLSIERLAISRGWVEFEDQEPKGGFRLRLEPVDLVGTNLSTATGAPASIELTARGDGGESIGMRGELRFAEGLAEARLKAGGWVLPRAHPYLDAVSPLSITQGLLAFEVPVRVRWSAAGLELSVEDASATVTDLAVVERASGETFAAASSVEVTGAHASVADKTARLGELRIRGARLEVRRRTAASGDVETNVRGLVEPEVIDRLVSDLTDWQLAVGRVALDGAEVGITDRVVQPAVLTRLEAIQFQGDGLSNATNGEPFTVQTSLRWGEAGTVGAEGEARFFPARARLAVQLQDLALDPAAPYLGEIVRLTLNRAKLSARLEASYGRSSPTNPMVQVGGNIAVTDLAATEHGTGSDFIRWDEVALNGLSAGLDPNRVDLAELLVRGLQTSLVILTNGQLNVLSLLQQTRELGEREAAGSAARTEAGSNTAATDSTASGSTNAGPFWASWPVHLGRLTLQEVSVFAGDELYGNGFRTQIESLDGEVRNLGLPAMTPAEVDLKGRLSAVSGFSLVGSINPDPARFATDLRLTTEKADLTQLTPYSIRFAGYPVTAGQLTADVRYQVDGMALEAANNLLIEGFTLGAKTESPDAIDLPLKMGVALLKDSEGRITLDVPLTGSLDDPQFRVGPLVWQAVKNILVKAVTAPFKLLGSLFGGGSEEQLEFVEFEAGASEIPTAQTNRLATLQRALLGRPQLTLLIVPSFAPEPDTRALAGALLEKRLRSLRVEEIGASGAPLPDAAAVTLSPEDRTRLLNVAYLRDFGALPDTAAPSDGVLAPPGTPAAPAEGAVPAPVSIGLSATNTASVSLDGGGRAGPVSSPGRQLDPVERRLLETTRVPPEALMELAKRRAEGVRQALLGVEGLDAARLSLGGVETNKPGEDLPRVHFRLE